MKTTHGKEIADRITRIVDDAKRIEAIAMCHENDVDEVRHGASREIANLKSEIAKLQFTIDNLRIDLAKRPEYTKDADPSETAPTCEVTPGPDYVTRAELVTAFRRLGLHAMSSQLEMLKP